MAASPGPSAIATELLERGSDLDVLADSFATVTSGAGGRMVLVGGEAGVGKTVLLRHFCKRQPTRTLWGACDALFTPRPLGAFLDIAAAVGGELAAIVDAGGRPHELAAALVRELAARPGAIVVLEDLHWADEATLDVVTLVGRRIDAVPALVVGSYRDDQLDRFHPLRIALGELATTGALRRVRLLPLSRDGVAALARPHAVDADELYRKTAGNPFFVVETLAAAGQELPETVRDAVLARTARLGLAARQLVEAVAVVPPQADVWLLDAIAGDAIDGLDECLTSGMLCTVPDGVAFRHELARLAVEESLTPARRLVLHRKALAALAAPPGGAPDLARLAHHAEAAGDADAVLDSAPAAAARAASLGAYREAAAQYARAIRFGANAPPELLGELFDRRAYACYLTGQFAEAIEAQERALACHRRSGRRLEEGDGLRSLSRLLRYAGRQDAAWATGREAVGVLEALPPGRELALAYANLSHLHMIVEDAEGTAAWGSRALELARALGDVESEVYALTNIATIELLAGVPGAVAKLERSLALARAAGFEEHAGRAFVALTWWAPRGRSYALTDGYLDPALEYCSERGLDLWRLYLLAYRARAALDRGGWDRAADDAALILQDPRSPAVPRIVALATLGLVRARRGDPDVWPPLDEAWLLAEPTTELQRIEPAAAARAEAAWLERRPEVVAEATTAPLELARRRQAWWVVGELASWRRRAGIADEPLPGVPDPYAAELAGDWPRAARAWGELDSPYEAALALAEADDEATLRRALEELEALGAQPAATFVRRTLHERGARGVRRGPRRSTQENPSGLTTRELEVLRLLAQGLRNSEIASRLVLSERTVDHHVAAILRKLGVRTRGQAGAEAVKLGIAGQEG